jgi:hypothetical protein
MQIAKNRSYSTPILCRKRGQPEHGYFLLLDAPPGRAGRESKPNRKSMILQQPTAKNALSDHQILMVLWSLSGGPSEMRRDPKNKLEREASKLAGKKAKVFVRTFANGDEAALAKKKLSEKLGRMLTVSQNDGFEIWTVRKSLDS